MGKLNDYFNSKVELIIDEKLLDVYKNIDLINKNIKKLKSNKNDLKLKKYFEEIILSNIETITKEIDQVKNLINPVPKEEEKVAEDVSIFYENEIYMNGERIFSRNNLQNFVININGSNTNHKIYLNSTEGNGKIFINFSGFNNIFEFGSNNVVRNDLLIEYWGCHPNIYPENVAIEIGDNNYLNGEKIKFISPIENGRSIKIGDCNLFAGYITFRGRNDHVIYDINTKKRINIDHDIIIGNNIWICDSVIFLPKTNITGNAVIAEHSLVNKEFKKSNILIAGMPATIKKEGIMWHINLDDSYRNSEYPISNIK